MDAQKTMTPNKVFTIYRLPDITHGMNGVIADEKEYFALTLENRHLHIPAGEYNCPKDFYHNGNYATYMIPVENRTRILFHKGNVEEDSVGCILIAQEFGTLKGRRGILSSADGFAEFMARAGGASQIKLVIKQMK